MKMRQVSAARRGQALTEFALVVPIFLLFLLGIFEIGMMIRSKLVLQDAVRIGLRYGAEAGRTSAPDGCLADELILQVIADRIKGSAIDPRLIRSVYIYAAQPTNNADPVTVTAFNAEHPSNALPDPNTGDLVGDYYYSDYDPTSGLDLATNGTLPPRPSNTNTTPSAMSLLFAGSRSTIFAGSTVTTPKCGVALHGASSAYYTDGLPPNANPPGVSGSSWITQSGNVAASGNWPPGVRVDQTASPDRVGVDIVYDYRLQTPIFQSLASIFTRLGLFRMDEHATYYLNPQ